MKIEARPYGANSTPQEIEALRERCTIYEPGVLLWREVPVPTAYSIDIMMSRIGELTRDWSSFVLLIDLTEPEHPSPEVRAKLKEFFTSQSKISFVAIWTGRNFMLNVAAKFVLSGLGLRAVSVHKTMEQALSHIQRRSLR